MIAEAEGGQVEAASGTLIEFAFTVDRFGFRPGAHRDVAFAHSVIDALNHWEAIITGLFGDFAQAITLAIQAGMLPEHPTRQRIANLRAELSQALEAAASNGNGNGIIIETQTRATLEELRLFLDDLYTWSETFHAGARAAALAGAGSLEPNAATRRLRGLQTLMAVFEFVLPISRHDAREAFENLSSAGKKLVPQELLNVWSSEAPTVSSSFGSFAEEPTRMRPWLDELKAEIDGLSDRLGMLRIKPDSWQAVENGFWQLWRLEQPGVITRDSDCRDITVLDLIHATRHGTIPVVPPRGGHLSIGQWSRIFGMARARDRLLPSDVAGYAAKSLGIEELAADRPIVHDRNAKIVVIRPLSSRSQAWKWVPQEDVRAIALMPNDIAEADQAITPEVAPPGATARDNSVNLAISDAVGSLTSRIFFVIPVPVTISEFIELGDDITLASVSEIQKLTPNAMRAFFAFDPYVADIRNPSDVGDLRKASIPVLFRLQELARRLMRLFVPDLVDSRR
jgi:hypothetical protein